MDAGEALTADLVARLRAAGCVFAEDEAAILLESAGDAEQLDRMLQRRVVGEPLEHVVGWAAFAGMRVEVGPGVFVPRPRSEALVDAAVAIGLAAETEHVVVLDLCCGSGALGLAVATRLRTAGRDVAVTATDVDPTAVAFARRNLRGVGTALVSDLFASLPSGLRGTVDVLVANAPYVPTGEIGLLPPEAREHEPLGTLDGGDDGLAVHRRIAAEAGSWLAPGGALCIEVAERQVDAATALLRGAGLRPRLVDEIVLVASPVPPPVE